MEAKNCLNCAYEPEWFIDYKHSPEDLKFQGLCQYMYMSCLPVSHKVEIRYITVWKRNGKLKTPEVAGYSKKIENNCDCWKEK